MIEILLTIIIILSITLIFFFIRGFVLVKKIEMMEDIISEYELKREQTRDELEFMAKFMKDIDIRGSFESDDEVGVIFKQLQEIITTYNPI
jgi:uncharacterized protein YneF (UPF0154 family)